MRMFSTERHISELVVLQCIYPRWGLSPRAARLTNGWTRSWRPPHDVGLIPCFIGLVPSASSNNHLWLLLLMIHPIQGPYFSIISMSILKNDQKAAEFSKEFWKHYSSPKRRQSCFLISQYLLLMARRHHREKMCRAAPVYRAVLLPYRS